MGWPDPPASRARRMDTILRMGRDCQVRCQAGCLSVIGPDLNAQARQFLDSIKLRTLLAAQRVKVELEPVRSAHGLSRH